MLVAASTRSFNSMTKFFFVYLCVLAKVLKSTSSDKSDFNVDTFLNLSPSDDSVTNDGHCTSTQLDSPQRSLAGKQNAQVQTKCNVPQTGKKGPRKIEKTPQKRTEASRSRRRERAKQYREELKNRPKALAIRKEQRQQQAVKRYLRIKSDPQKYKVLRIRMNKNTQAWRARQKKKEEKSE